MKRIEKAVSVVTLTSRQHHGRRNSLRLRLKLRECRGEVDGWLQQAARAMAAAERAVQSARRRSVVAPRLVVVDQIIPTIRSPWPIDPMHNRNSSIRE